ncbi:head maturation protease, ClpP-related [Heyndrickxia coagulans]|uniref:head maturation protease, ClpP-related n=1 Tax=Heyndrickxia coagulans TaxID=1398 RepID=UPI00145274CC|nr:head maturation protease, ClpP-related [Heyndrickxia coagulans]MED4492823.1 Clp protease ClpP [Heyndrickxia coagulans]MED4535002.1 Clp protease ClpP [Heyndrickxia coagulans]QJE31809.1 Clp protease ClpP [Heyndrickxia coagulans]
MIKRFKNEKFNSLPPIEKLFKCEAVDGDTTKLTIYGDIGASFWGGESVTATDVKNALKDVQAKELHVHINSYGGDAFDGIAIFNQLRDHQAKVITHVDGVAASAASIIAMAGDEIIMNLGSMLMIHEASTGVWGNKTDMQKALNSLEGLDKSLANIYMTRFKGEQSEVETLMKNETWFAADEAVDIGLADRVNNEGEKTDQNPTNEVDPEAFKNSILSRFRKAPAPAAASAQPDKLAALIEGLRKATQQITGTGDDENAN